MLGTTPLSPAPAWLRSTLPREARGNNALGQQSAGGWLAPMGAVASATRHPARPSHHCDAQGAQGVKGPSPELAWSPQVRSDLTVCTCGREPSWESRYTQQRRRWRKPPTTRRDTAQGSLGTLHPSAVPSTTAPVLEGRGYLDYLGTEHRRGKRHRQHALACLGGPAGGLRPRWPLGLRLAHSTASCERLETRASGSTYSLERGACAPPRLARQHEVTSLLAARPAHN